MDINSKTVTQTNGNFPIFIIPVKCLSIPIDVQKSTEFKFQNDEQSLVIFRTKTINEMLNYAFQIITQIPRLHY